MCKININQVLAIPRIVIGENLYNNPSQMHAEKIVTSLCTSLAFQH